MTARLRCDTCGEVIVFERLPILGTVQDTPVAPGRAAPRGRGAGAALPHRDTEVSPMRSPVRDADTAEGVTL